MPRVGIVGGGQLGRMLALAGYPLGIITTVLDPSPDSCASQVALSILAGYDDQEALIRLAGVSDVITYEFENVSVTAIRSIADRVPVLPSPRSLEAAQDRLAEKTAFDKAGLETAAFAPVGSLDELIGAIGEVGLPAVLKTRRLGYDGKGQAVLRDPQDAARAWESVGGAQCILEELVGFDEEVSIVAVRGRDGDPRFYPLAINTHSDGLLRRTRVPTEGPAIALQSSAERYAEALMTELDHVGVMAVELFRVGDRLLGNEIAPRVHNSGHWTIEGCETSQFENHMRAISGLPLGATTRIGEAAMVNLIGRAPDPAAVAAVPGAHLHLYGKEPRPGRKIGHITVRAADGPSLERALLQVEALVDDDA